MVFTAAAIALLKQLEGLRLDAYLDGAGVPTIGYGTTGPGIALGVTWTQEQADAALATSVGAFARGVPALVHVSLSDAQFSALVIFAYNVGLQALAGSTALRRVNGGLFSMVPEALGSWCHIHDPHTGALVVSPGLQHRRQAEIDLWNS